MLATDGKFEKVKTVITEALPKSHGAWWFLNIAQNDFKLAFNGHEMETLVDCHNMVVPKFKGLPNTYR